jgi:hypothetical protein
LILNVLNFAQAAIILCFFHQILSYPNWSKNYLRKCFSRLAPKNVDEIDPRQVKYCLLQNKMVLQRFLPMKMANKKEAFPFSQSSLQEIKDIYLRSL